MRRTTRAARTACVAQANTAIVSSQKKGLSPPVAARLQAAVNEALSSKLRCANYTDHYTRAVKPLLCGKKSEVLGWCSHPDRVELTTTEPLGRRRLAAIGEGIAAAGGGGDGLCLVQIPKAGTESLTALFGLAKDHRYARDRAELHARGACVVEDVDEDVQRPGGDGRR